MSQRKRGQNEGSIYQRSDGYWCAAVSLGNGKRKVVYARTAEGALRKRDELRRAIEEGAALHDGRATVGQLFDAWLEAKRGTIRPKTFERYEGLVQSHVSEVASVRIAKLKVADIEALYRQRSAKLSPKTIRHIHFVLKAGLAWAVRRQMIARNPADMIALEDLPRVERRPLKVLSVDQIKDLMRAASGTRSDALITFALVTGARIGEVMGLTWDRLDLDSGRARITHALQYVNSEPILVEPKTKAAVRELVLPSFALTILRAHRAIQNEQALRLGPAWSNSLNLVFTRETGGPLNRHAVLRQHLRPLLKKAELPETVRVHDLRHGAASLMLAQGVPVPVVSELLGHATPAITMSIYSHALPDSQQIVASQMEATFAGV